NAAEQSQLKYPWWKYTRDTIMAAPFTLIALPQLRDLAAHRGEWTFIARPSFAEIAHLWPLAWYLSAPLLLAIAVSAAQFMARSGTRRGESHRADGHALASSA